ncbi:MAG: hypothetical protein J6Y89_03770, partial [Lachnospiraceae bacterium]|nr:hypothetical protein [Lachnospiraceae bacterium]
MGGGAEEVLIHRNRLEPDAKDKFEFWGRRVLSWKDNGVEKTPILHTDNNSNPVYSYTGTKNDTELTNKYPDVAYSKCKLPSLLTEAGMLDYKVCYEGNAILIPKEPLTYFTNVQGTLVEVTSDSDVKLQYAVEKSTVGSTKANWILGTNTVKVRLEAEYIYTRLVPMTDGKYEEASFAGELTTANGYKTNKGQYGRSTSITSENDTIIPVYNSEGSKEYYNDYGTFTTVQKDLLNGNTVYIVSNCPVQTVLEKVTFYTDVECYIIDTDMVKNDTSDKNVYLKDYLKDKIATEEFRFVKEKSSFSVKY